MKINRCSGNTLHFTNDSLEQLGCRFTHHFWTENTEYSANNSHEQHSDQLKFMWL
ncbi:hypothetical protein D3C81_1659790 [compost metagenome]